MASNADMRAVVKHIVEGDFGQTLCRICLLPLSEEFESVFTTVYKEDRAYSVADVLQKICKIEISQSDHFNVCKDCFYAAAAAYEFYLVAVRSTEILESYTDELNEHVFSVTLPSDYPLYFVLPALEIKTKLFDFNLKGCLKRDHKIIFGHENMFDEELKSEDSLGSFDLNKSKTESTVTKTEPYCFDYDLEKPSETDTDTVLMIVTESSDSQSFTALNNADESLIPETKVAGNRRKQKCSAKLTNLENKSVEKVRKKRCPLALVQCSKCPIKYRFLARLKEHMKTEHDIHLYICKLCKTTCETEQEFTKHLRCHRGIHRCHLCDAVFRKVEALTAHVDGHIAHMSMEKSEHMSMRSNMAHICEQCGAILPDDLELQEHYEKKHLKKFTCHFCGRLYRCKTSLDRHIAKHEKYHGNERPTQSKSTPKCVDASLTCQTCGKQFVDHRALQWHCMLHTNERPFKCDVCDRGFISANRRNQHALCAHTAPTRRCPLCPALFHLRSMVNTHIKKVHLTAHKRRSRASKHQNASWRTVTVPIPDLSVELQDHILELKNKLNEFEVDEEA